MSVDLNFENAVWLRVMNDHLKVLDERLAERKSSSTRRFMSSAWRTKTLFKFLVSH